MVWPPRSPDLTACGISLWGIVKENISKPRIRIEYWRRVCFNDFQPPTWQMSRRTMGEIKIFAQKGDENPDVF
jgi:hypothetical protein